MVLDADLRSLTQVWMGDVRFVDALDEGRITLTGPRELTNRIPDWFGNIPFWPVSSVADRSQGLSSVTPQ